MRLSIAVISLALLCSLGTAQAADYLRDRGQVETLLKGRTLHGTYLRTQSHYTLEFRADGALVNPAGGEGRWWVDDSGRYCREWLTGRLKGNRACLDLSRQGDGIAIWSHGKKVADGTLSPPGP